jgi:outer membrane protein assembly factor BamA
MLRTIRYTFVLLAITIRVQAQSDTLLPRKSSFLPLPVLGYSPEKGLEMGAAMLYSFYTNKNSPDRVTRNSAISLIPSITTKNQYKIDLKSDIWTKDNTWHFRGELRYHNYPVYFYGIGDTTHYDDRTLVGNTRFKIQLEGERRITGHFYLGASLMYQYNEYTAKDDKGIYPGLMLTDKTGGNVTFLGVTGIFDNRDNQNFTTKGSWLKLNVAYAPAFLSTRPLWKIEAQGKQFFSISPKSTIGFNGYLNSVQGKNIPFYLLPEMGNDMIMRGYYTGRYRQQNYLALQTEYRYLIDPKIRIKIWFVDTSPTFALAAFAGTGTVFSNSNFQLSHWKPNYGMGVRYFYDKAARLSVRIDYGWGEKRPGENRQSGFYLSLAEAF